MIKGLLALFSWIIIASLAPTVLKLATKEIPPLTISFLRFLIATLLLFPIFWFKKPQHIKKKDLLHLIVISILGTGVNAGFYVYGIQSTSVILAQVLYATVPIIIVILSFFLHGEKLNKYQLVGTMLGFIGVFFLVSESLFQKDISALGSPLGNVFILFSVLSWSLYTFFSKKLLNTYSITTVTFFNFFSGTLVLFPFVFLESSILKFSLLHISPSGILNVMFLAVISSIIAFFLYQYGVVKTSPFIASLVFYISPIAVTVPATVFLGEKITLPLIIGSAFTFAGVFIAVIYARIKKRQSRVVQ